MRDLFRFGMGLLVVVPVLACSGQGTRPTTGVGDGDQGSAGVGTTGAVGGDQQGSGSTEAARNELARVYREVMEAHPPSHPIEDSPEERGRRRVVDRLAEITGLDFVQLSVVQYGRGLSGLREVMETLDDDEPGRSARWLIRLAWALSSSSPDGLRSLFEEMRDTSLSPEAQRLAWLEQVIDAQALRGFVSESADRDRTHFPSTVRCAELAGLPFDRLVRLQPGYRESSARYLLLTLRAFPDFPERDACVQLFADDEE